MEVRSRRLGCNMETPLSEQCSCQRGMHVVARFHVAGIVILSVFVIADVIVFQTSCKGECEATWPTAWQT